MKKIKIYTLTVLLDFTTSYFSWGQSNTIKLANSQQIRLEKLQSKIDSIVSKAINQLGPGLSVGIIYRDKL